MRGQGQVFEIIGLGSFTEFPDLEHRLAPLVPFNVAEPGNKKFPRSIDTDHSYGADIVFIGLENFSNSRPMLDLEYLIV